MEAPRRELLQLLQPDRPFREPFQQVASDESAATFLSVYFDDGFNIW